MSLILKDEGGGTDFEIVPEGIHICVCDQVIDLGQQETNYGTKHQIYIRWQVIGQTVEIKGEQLPMIIGNTYNASMHPDSNLGKHLAAWRGRTFSEEEKLGFDIKAIAGAGCQIQVVHNKSKDGQKTYANIGAIMGLPPGTPNPEVTGQIITYDSGDGETTVSMSLAPWLRKKLGLEEKSREPGSDDGPPNTEAGDPGVQQETGNPDAPFNDQLPPIGSDTQIPF